MRLGVTNGEHHVDFAAGFVARNYIQTTIDALYCVATDLDSVV
jgi:hypothetical protein